MARNSQLKGEMNLEEKAQIEKEVQFLKKRLDQSKQENEILRKDNKVLRSEMVSLKDTVKNIAQARPKTAIEKNKTIQNEDQLRFVLDYQSKKLEEAEKELDTYKNKYEQLLYSNQKQSKNANQTTNYNQAIRAESVVLAEQFSQSSEYVIELKKQNESLEEKVKYITTQYAQEIAQLKSKLAKQDAILLTNNKSTLSNSSINNSILNSNLQNNSLLKNSNFNAVSQSQLQNAASLSYNSRSKVQLDVLSSPQVNNNIQSTKNTYNSSQLNNNAASNSSLSNNNYKPSQRQSSQSNIQYDNNDNMFSYKKRNY